EQSGAKLLGSQGIAQEALKRSDQWKLINYYSSYSS
ncbi:hypothetical protein GCK32_019148, partial [Trichostrongylus colubriformis]